MELIKNKKEYQKYLTTLAVDDLIAGEDSGQLPPKEYPCLVEIALLNGHNVKLRFIYRKDVAPLFE